MASVGVQRPGAGLRAPAPSPRSFAVVREPETLGPLGLDVVPVVGAVPSEVDIVVYQGDDVRFTIPVLQDGDPAVLIGCTIDSQIRASASDNNVLATITTTVADNNVSFWLAAADSANLTKVGAVWDAQITDSGGFITTFVAGKVIVTEQVTRT